MKVSDVMSKHVDFVSRDTSIRDVSRIIFGRGINGVPVCKNKKVVGFITEKDILAKFFPSMQEYMEDPFHSSDFEGMESKVQEIFEMHVDSIMSKNPITVTEDIPLLKAQSLMFVEKVGRLPVVDKDGNLVGMISKGDIFRSLVGQSLPLEQEEGFYDWQAKRYDNLIDWETRLDNEIPELTALFKKDNTKKILDVASSTGEHSIALAKKGFELFGIESSGLMDKIARRKLNKLPENLKKSIHFGQGKYTKLLNNLKIEIDSAILLGNTLPHILYEDKDILEKISSVLRKKDAIMVFQIVNFKKIFDLNKGLRDFTLRKDQALSYYKDHAFLGFYTKVSDKVVSYSRAVLSCVSKGKWSFVSVNSTSIADIREKEIVGLLSKLGFSDVKLYGGIFSGPLFKNPFDPLTSDWLNVVAKR